VIREVFQWENVEAKKAIARGMEAWEKEKAEGGDHH